MDNANDQQGLGLEEIEQSVERDKNAKRSLAKYLHDDAFTDFELVCGDKTFKVHRIVLSLHSTVLKRLCDSSFKEDIDRKMVLADDRLPVVELMVEYFYTNDYRVESTTTGGTFMKACHKEITTAPLTVHAAVFTIADKYGIPDLKTLAWLNFRKSATEPCIGDYQSLWTRLCQLPAATNYVYQNTPPNDKRMKGAVVAAWRAHDNRLMKRLSKRMFETLNKTPPRLRIRSGARFWGVQDVGVEWCETEVERGVVSCAEAEYQGSRHGLKRLFEGDEYWTS